jgi:hypothetical protein
VACSGMAELGSPSKYAPHREHRVSEHLLHASVRSVQVDVLVALRETRRGLRRAHASDVVIGQELQDGAALNVLGSFVGSHLHSHILVVLRA